MFSCQQSYRLPSLTDEQQRVLSKAASRACGRLSLDDSLFDTLCADRGKLGIDPGPYREQLVAQRLLSVFVRLSTIVGQQDQPNEKAQAWCGSTCFHLDDQKPADLMRSRTGLRTVERYLRELTQHIQFRAEPAPRNKKGAGAN